MVAALRRRARRPLPEVNDYRAFGLHLRTALDLPCRRIPRSSSPHVRLLPFTGNAERVTLPRAEAGWFHHEKLIDGTDYLRWTELFDFLISADGRRILYRPLKRATPETMQTYLLGQVLSFSLVAFGVDPLHGTVVSRGNHAIALIGDCGRGKSTLGASMLTRGWQLVTDDLVAVERRPAGWFVLPGIPRIKLFPAVARRLGLGLKTSAPMNRKTTKLVIPVTAAVLAANAVRLSALYILAPPAPQTTTITIEPLSPRDAFLEVIRGAFNLLILSRERLKRQFAFATRLAGTVPVRRLTYPRSLRSLPAVCDALAADASRFQSPLAGQQGHERRRQ